MSATFPPGLGYSTVAAKWGWFVAFGLGLLILGVIALGDVVAVSLISTIFIGATMLVGGVFQIGHAFFMKGSWSNFALSILGGLLYLVGGVLIMNEPVQGSIIITLFLLAALSVGGIMRIVIGLRHREIASWWLLVLGGVISVVLSVMLFMSMPWSGLWVLGTLVAVELIVHGVTWLMFGLALRRLRHHGGAIPA